MYILNEVRKGTHSFAAMLHATLLNHCMCAAIERLEYLQVGGWVGVLKRSITCKNNLKVYCPEGDGEEGN